MTASVVFTPLRRIATGHGDVLHALKASDPAFGGFGEAYFSTVLPGALKGWKRHRRMVMNLVVPCGAVRFILHDDRRQNGAEDLFQDFTLASDPAENYGRLTVPAGLWMAFQGVGGGLNLVLNLASIEHDPEEVEARPIDAFPWRRGEPALFHKP